MLLFVFVLLIFFFFFFSVVLVNRFSVFCGVVRSDVVFFGRGILDGVYFFGFMSLFLFIILCLVRRLSIVEFLEYDDFFDSLFLLLFVELVLVLLRGRRYSNSF